MTEEHVLAIDLGTGGPKVALVAVDGTVTGHDFEPTTLRLLPGGGAEQDPADWIAAITAAARRLLGRGLVAPDSIVGVSVTAQWMGTVAVDAGGHPLHPALIWMDARGAADSHGVTGGGIEVPGTGYNARRLRQWLRLTGGVPLRTGKDPVGHILWLRHHRPDVYAAAATFLDVPDYLNLWLSGRACASFDTVVGFWCTDNRDLTAVDYDNRLVAYTGIDRAKLPELVPTNSVIGELRADVAEALGLGNRSVARAIPVTTATGDTASAAIGAGAVRDYDAHLYIGTSSWLSCHVPFQRTDIRTNISSLPSGIPGRYWVATEQDVAGKALEWVLPLVGLDRDPDPYGAAAALAAAAPPGCDGVLFAPWLNGEQTPVGDHHLRGLWFNLGLGTSRAHLVRSVYEGVALNTRWMLEAAEGFVRKARPNGFPELTFVGGGARSPGWAQILADVLDRPVRRAAEPVLANVRGAGLAGAVALGRLTWAEVPGRVAIDHIHAPDPSRRAVYDKRYDEFRALHRRTKGLFAKIAG